MGQRAPRVSEEIEATARPHRHHKQDVGPRVGDSGLLALQGAVGNRAIQAKLEIDAADSPLEAEADRIADEVAGPTVSRSASSGAAPPPAIDPQTSSAIQTATGGGHALDTGIQGEMEGALGVDLSGVRVHTDGQADSLSRSIQAKAFTTGSDVFFKSGAYNPASDEGRHLIAHEVAHVAQQSPVVSRVPDDDDWDNPWLDDGDSVKQPAHSPKPTGPPKNTPPLQNPNNLMVPGAKVKPPSPPAPAKLGVGDPGISAPFNTKFGRGNQYLGAGLAGQVRDDADFDAALDVQNSQTEAKRTYVAEGATTGLIDEGRFGDDPADHPPHLAALSSRWNAFLDPEPAAQAEGAKFGLDQAEVAALTTYTDDDYKYMNPAVANNDAWLSKAPGSAAKEGITLQGTHADRKSEGSLHGAVTMSAFAKLPPWQGMGYRGVGMTATEFAGLAPGGTMSDATFKSVSKTQSEAESFAVGKDVQVVYHMAVTNARSMREFSRYPDEDEVLCPPGSTFTIESIDQRPGEATKYDVKVIQTR